MRYSAAPATLHENARYTTIVPQNPAAGKQLYHIRFPLHLQDTAEHRYYLMAAQRHQHYTLPIPTRLNGIPDLLTFAFGEFPRTQ